MSSAATPPLPCLWAKRGEVEPPHNFWAWQDSHIGLVQSQTAMSSVSVENPNLTHHPARRQESLQRAIQLQGMTGTVKAPNAHDQTTGQVGTNQAIIHDGYLYDPNKRVRPLRGRPLWSRLCSWVRIDRGNGRCHGNEVTRGKAARVPYDTCQICHLYTRINQSASRNSDN